ncbi:MAG: hypothetical protein KDB26_13420 [Microthrixaceae bacterium]|nr:hypothetical protein [Microthrixaceae bacterium]
MSVITRTTLDPVSRDRSDDDGQADSSSTDSGIEAPQRSARNARTRILTGSTALALLVGGIYAVVGSRQLSDNSFLTHLATGRVLLDSGLPGTNPFLYSSESFPIPSYWWSLILATVEKLTGGAGIRVLTALGSAALGVLIVRLASRSDSTSIESVGESVTGDTVSEGRSLLAIVVPTVLATVCVMPFLNSRPQLPGFILLALTVLIWNERRSPWWLVPVFAAWVNVHGTWLYGIAILGLFGVAELVEQRRVNSKRVLALGAAVTGTVLGGALYPRAFEIMLLPTRQFGNETERAALRLYREWRPVAVDDPLFWLLIGLGLVAVFGSVQSGSGLQRRWASAISAIGLVVLGLSGVRMVPIAAIALVPIVSSSLSRLGTIEMVKGRVATVLGTLGLIVIAGAIVHSAVGPSYDLRTYPTAMVDRMVDADLIGGDTKSLTHDYVGNFLEWRLGTEANTFVDDRPGAQTFIDYATILGANKGWQQALTKADPDVIIWNEQYRELPQKLRGSSEWVRSKKIGEWLLYCKPELVDRCKAI